MSFIVAIDGPAGAGKGTITKQVSEKLGFINIDTGAMYRCVTIEMLEKNIDFNDNEDIEKMLDEIKIDLKNENGKDLFFLNGRDVTTEIRTKKVNENVSQISHIPIIRQNMSRLQRKMAIGKKAIMEGRDIGTNVFPDADVKIYLDATPEERANRRYKQNKEAGIESNYDEILENIKFRDYNDKTSKVAPLKMADDAIYLDSTNLNIDEVVEKVISIIRDKLDSKKD